MGFHLPEATEMLYLSKTFLSNCVYLPASYFLSCSYFTVTDTGEFSYR